MQISKELKMWIEDNIDMLEATQQDPTWWKAVTTRLMMLSSYLVEELIHLLDVVDMEIPNVYLRLWKMHIDTFRN